MLHTIFVNSGYIWSIETAIEFTICFLVLHFIYKGRKSTFRYDTEGKKPQVNGWQQFRVDYMNHHSLHAPNSPSKKKKKKISPIHPEPLSHTKTHAGRKRGSSLTHFQAPIYITLQTESCCRLPDTL